MSDQHDNFDLREQMVRIDRAIAESRKFAAEQNKLAEEAQKLHHERRWLVPLALLGNGALAAIIGALVARLLH
jgi:hypothetical protein